MNKVESRNEVDTVSQGHDVWIIMNKDKRARLKDEPELEEHTFFYRDMDKDHGVIGKV